MKLRWVAILATGLGFGLGCSQPESSASHPDSLRPDSLRPDLDTLRAGLGERDDLERKYLLTSFLRTLRPEDVPPMLAEVEKHRIGFDAEEVRLLMLAWTRFDGPGAFATARDWPTPWRSILMVEAMHAWGFNDGRAALAACEQIEDEELRKDLRIALVSGWVESRDRLGASEFAATAPKGRRRSRLALRLAGEAMRDGPEAVIAWAEAVPADAPNGFKGTVFDHAAGILARYDPERVVPFYERHMKHSYTRSTLLNLAGKWAQYHDPGALMAWIATLPIEESREGERGDAARVAFRSWAAEAPGELEVWLESASDGPIRDHALDELARALGDASPAGALSWVGQITDEDLRRRRTLKYSYRWFAKDPNAAGAWLAEADMPPGWRRQIVANSPQAIRWNKAKNAQPSG